ncbi:MAG: hypothetical protein HC886_18115, partial [Leptolyngbyaceae cyanobacterium SM1_1_3]|nr:hypothetical protein [Leptolyngbyaceae cyanobacterium SM1_1_3]
SDDTINLEVALTAKSLAPRLAVVVRNQDAEFAQQVQQVFEFERVMSPTDLAAPAFAAAALGGRILGNGMTANSLLGGDRHADYSWASFFTANLFEKRQRSQILYRSTWSHLRP